MNWKTKSGIVVLLGAMLVTTRMEAQRTRDVSFGISGGFSQGPMGPYSQKQIGYNIMGSVEVGSPLPFVRLRGEGLFADWTSHRVGALIGNVVLSPLPSRSFSPYAIAGAGVYNSESSKSAGWTLGVGGRLPVASGAIFVESRMHAFHVPWRNADTPAIITKEWRTMYTPISFGLQF